VAVGRVEPARERRLRGGQPPLQIGQGGEDVADGRGLKLGRSRRRVQVVERRLGLT
jgi:hypothetical protein